MQALKYTSLILICLLSLGRLNPAAAAQSGFSMKNDHTAERPPAAEKQIIPETKLRRLFQAYICETLNKVPGDIAVLRFKVSGNRPIEKGNVSFRIFQKSKGRPKGHVRLSAVVSVDGLTRSEVTLSAWVDVFGPVVCAARTLNRGEMIREDDLYLARKNLSRLSEKILTEKQMAIGLSAKSTLNEHTCLKAYMLRRVPTLDRGELVTILVQLGALKVTTPGKTLESGFAGEQIRVQNAMSKKKIYARIVDDATVEVDF
jgi:flagella basal body P-ring formation protein FlgA